MVSLSEIPELHGTNKGPLRALAMMSRQRSPSLPDVPTAEEAGVAIVSTAERGFAVPKGVPDDVVKKLEAAIADSVRDPDYIKSLQGKSSAVTQGDILPITTALGTLGRFNTPFKQYNTLLGSALDAVDNARANNYGATNQLGLIPDDDAGDALRKRVNKAYLPGGASFVGQGKPMPADELAAAKKSIADDPASKAMVVDLYRRHGFNTKPIE